MDRRIPSPFAITGCIKMFAVLFFVAMTTGILSGPELANRCRATMVTPGQVASTIGVRTVTASEAGVRYGLCAWHDQYTGSETWWKRVRGVWVLLGGGGGAFGAVDASVVHRRYGVPENLVAPLTAAIAKAAS